MMKFILKGLIRDKSRSLFPIITTSIGVIVTIFMYTYLKGFTEDLVNVNAAFHTGHVKIVTRAYADLIEQRPNDLALIGVQDLLTEMNKRYPQIQWAERIHFGGLIDVPDEHGETKEQTYFSGMAIDLIPDDSIEHDLLQPNESLVRGRAVDSEDEILIGDELANGLNISLGDTVTLISDTMEGNMTFGNFIVVGTVRFGVTVMDRRALIADIGGVRRFLDMDDAASELLGFLPEFDDQKVDNLAADFNQKYSDNDDEFSPFMLSLLDQENLRGFFNYTNYMSSFFIAGFIMIMSIVLWNAGLMNGIRRYGEIGVRLAIGESKLHLYFAMIYEAALIGLAGAVVGTVLGLIPSYLMQEVGVDVSSALPDVGMMMSDVIRSKVTTSAYFIGFIPGLFATTLGAALAGIGILRRNTAQLFEELEV